MTANKSFQYCRRVPLFMVRCSIHDPAHTLHKHETHLETHQKEIASTILISSLWHTPSTIDIDISIGASSHHMNEASPRKSSIYSAILKGGDTLAKVTEKVLYICNSKPVNALQVSFTMGFIALGRGPGAGSRGTLFMPPAPYAINSIVHLIYLWGKINHDYVGLTQCQSMLWFPYNLWCPFSVWLYNQVEKWNASLYVYHALWVLIELHWTAISMPNGGRACYTSYVLLWTWNCRLPLHERMAQCSLCTTNLKLQTAMNETHDAGGPNSLPSHNQQATCTCNATEQRMSHVLHPADRH